MANKFSHENIQTLILEDLLLLVSVFYSAMGIMYLNSNYQGSRKPCPTHPTNSPHHIGSLGKLCMCVYIFSSPTIFLIPCELIYASTTLLRQLIKRLFINDQIQLTFLSCFSLIFNAFSVVHLPPLLEYPYNSY